MNVAGEPFPGLMHKAAAFIEESATILIDDHSIRVDKNDRRGALAPGIDWLRVHAAPVAGARSTDFKRHTNAVAGVETCSRRNQPHRFCLWPEMLTHHLAIGLKTTSGEV